MLPHPNPVTGVTHHGPKMTSGTNVSWSSFLLSGMLLRDSTGSSPPFNASSAAALTELLQLEPDAEEDGATAPAEPWLSSPWWMQLVDASNTTYLYVFPLLLMIGILLNSVNFVLFRSSIGLRLYSFTIFICTVSLTDSLALVAQAPRRWLTLLYQALHWHSLLQPNTSYDTSDAACKALTYAAQLLQFVSLWTVVLLAWERSIVAQNPYRQSRFRQTRTACHAVAFVVISGLLLNSHVILSWQTATQPIVAMATGNATSSSLTSVITSKQDVVRSATTKWPPSRNLATRPPCSTYNRGNRMRKGKCVEENAEKARTKQRNEGVSGDRKSKKDAISQRVSKDLLHSKMAVRGNDKKDMTTVSLRLSSTYDHQEDSTAERNDGSNATAPHHHHHPGATFPNYPKEEDRDTLRVLHRMSTKTTTVGDDPTTDVTTSSSRPTSAISPSDINKTTELTEQSTGNVTVEMETTESQLETKEKRWGPNERESIKDAALLNPLQQGLPNVTPSFVKAPQALPESPLLMESNDLADSLDNASKTDVAAPVTSVIHMQETVGNGSGPTPPGNISSSSSANDDQPSLEARPQHERALQHERRALNETVRRSSRLRHRLKRRRDTASSQETTQPKAKPCSLYVSGQCQFIVTNNRTAIWTVSVAVEALTLKVLPSVLLIALLVSSLTGLRSWNIDQTRLTTDLTCRLLMERHVTVMAVCIITSQVVLCLPMSVVWLVDLYFRLVTGGLSACHEGQMAAANVLTELLFMVNFSVKFLVCFLSGRQILSI